ncbi:hypothetical protein ACHQM5_027247 [Ranunculus cassubicifolius]
MAQVSSISSAIAVFVVMTILSVVTVSAQFDEMAPAPAPNAVTGSAFSMPISYTVIVSSILVSMFAFLKN